VSVTMSRLEILERYGRCYGANHLAVAFTQATAGDLEAKRCITLHADGKRPLHSRQPTRELRSWRTAASPATP
jgi:hypothetical protein